MIASTSPRWPGPISTHASVWRPPSLDANEIADKGYVNQAAVRARRAHLVDALFEASPADHVICLEADECQV